MFGIGAEPPAACGLLEPAPATLDLQREQATQHLFGFHDFNVGVDPVVLGRLLSKKPPQLILNSELGVSDPFAADLGSGDSTHHDHHYSLLRRGQLIADNDQHGAARPV